MTHYPLLLNLASVYPRSVRNVHLAVDTTGTGKLVRYRHALESGASVLATDYGIDIAERTGVAPQVLARAREIKCKILAAAPPGVDEARTGGDMGKLAALVKVLIRRLSSLKGASLDDRALRAHLDTLRAQLPPEQAARLRQALQSQTEPGIALHGELGEKSIDEID